jgi:hypothetical protein
MRAVLAYAGSSAYERTIDAADTRVSSPGCIRNGSARVCWAQSASQFLLTTLLQRVLPSHGQDESRAAQLSQDPDEPQGDSLKGGFAAARPKSSALLPAFSQASAAEEVEVNKKDTNVQLTEMPEDHRLAKLQRCLVLTLSVM